MPSPPSFEDYVTARWPRLVRSVVLLGADVHTAEDTVQNGLMRCHARWDRVVAARDIDAYVHRVVFHSYVDGRRRFWHRERPTARPTDSLRAESSAEIDLDDRLLLRAALGRLPLPQRQVVVLRFFADLTEPQTATVLGVAVGTVKSRASRALATLSVDPELVDAMRGEGL